MWGVGFALVDMRPAQTAQALCRHAMRRGDFLLALMSSRLVLMVIEIGLLLTLGVLVFRMKVLGRFHHPGGRNRRSTRLWRSRIADREPGAEN